MAFVADEGDKEKSDLNPTQEYGEPVRQTVICPFFRWLEALVRLCDNSFSLAQWGIE